MAEAEERQTKIMENIREAIRPICASHFHPNLIERQVLDNREIRCRNLLNSWRFVCKNNFKNARSEEKKSIYKTLRQDILVFFDEYFANASPYNNSYSELGKSLRHLGDHSLEELLESYYDFFKEQCITFNEENCIFA